jgi:hypothetical protein
VILRRARLVADGDGLENHCGGNVTVGSNPTPSAHDLGKQVLTWAYVGLSDVAGSSPTAARCSRLPPFVAGRGIYAGWILMRFPRSPLGKRKGPAENETLAW